MTVFFVYQNKHSVLMDTIDEPQISDYYNEEPNGVKIVECLNEEFAELQADMDKLKQRMKTYRSFYDKHKYLLVVFVSLFVLTHYLLY